MSTWSVRAIERLGAPSVLWPTIYGPEAGEDPIAANNLEILDLTPHLSPLSNFAQQIEQDMTQGSFSSIDLDLKDPDGSLAEALGPFSATMATSSRYYGPWIQVWENWEDGQSAMRYLGYLEGSSIQWIEDDSATQVTVNHASQLIQERLITDYPSLLRPWPTVPTSATQDWVQSTADALVDAAADDYTPRANAAEIESALWAVGELSWIAEVSQTLFHRVIWHLDEDPTNFYQSKTYAVPDLPAASLIIGGVAIAVDHLEWDTSINGTTGVDVPDRPGTVRTYRPVRIVLQGAPDLRGILHLGDTVLWGIPESQRSHYLMQGNTIAEPADGSDGQAYVPLNTVEQLGPGDILTLTFEDATSGSARLTTADLPGVIDLDGETGKVYLAKPLDQGYSNISKVRRNSQDPILFDGLAYARALIAPWTLDSTNFSPAATDVPVLVWMPYDVATPQLYGAVNIQSIDQAGKLLLARRGSDNGSGAFPLSGLWSGSWSAGWSWLGLPSAQATHEIYGDVQQWPGGVNGYSAPVIYVEGDLSGGALIPVNGWRPRWRSWANPAVLTQDPESTWDGSEVNWATVEAAGDIPVKLVNFCASTPTPGSYTRTSAGAWGFRAHTGSGTLAASIVPGLTGTIPLGNWIALGMGIWANGDEQEAVLGLVVTGTESPFETVKAVLLSQAAGGNLTSRQVLQLWASTDSIPGGAWALGGGLVIQSYTQVIAGLTYPRTVLHKLTGAAVLSVDHKTLEIIPGTIQPLLLTGASGSKVIRGWYAIALETYADDSYAATRRLRFIQLDEDLQIVNGDPEADPSLPTDSTADFRRGDIIASAVAPGSLIARMVRTSRTEDVFAGIIGGRLFAVQNHLPTTVERLKLDATPPKGKAEGVAYSGDGMTVSEFLEAWAAAQLATVVPIADGNMALVSRSAGPLRTRLINSQRVSVQASERSKRSKTVAWEGYLRKVRVSYNDVLADETVSVEETATFDGGRIAELDHSKVISGPSMARALARAYVYWFGQPVSVLNETWVDRTFGVAGGLAPAFWTGWQVGDRVTFTAYNPSAPEPIPVYKLITMRPYPEERSCEVELRQQPWQITPEA